MRERLLIVDDEIGVVGLLKSFFEMSGYTVYTACNGKDALKQAGCSPIWYCWTSTCRIWMG